MKYNLSEITEVIKNRRTIYPEDFSKRKVHKEIVENLLNNAIWAPTHGMTQPWRFSVFTDKGLISLSDFLKTAYKNSCSDDSFRQKTYDKFENRPKQSSAIIAVCIKPDPEKKIKEIEEIEAISCAIQNILLSATAYGIGSFWSTPKIMYSEKMNEFLGLEKNMKCLGLVYLGYPKSEWPKGQRKPIEYITNWIDA